MQLPIARSLFTTLLVLAACHVPEAPTTPSAAATEAKLDLAECAGRAWTGEEFLKYCTQASGLNFTYASEVAEGLRGTPLHVFGNTRLSRTELETFLGELLAVNGFELRRVGPEHLNVLEVRRKPS